MQLAPDLTEGNFGKKHRLWGRAVAKADSDYTKPAALMDTLLVPAQAFLINGPILAPNHASA